MEECTYYDSLSCYYDEGAEQMDFFSNGFFKIKDDAKQVAIANSEKGFEEYAEAKPTTIKIFEDANEFKMQKIAGVFEKIKSSREGNQKIF